MTETLQRPAASAPPQPEPPAFLRRPLVVGARWALTAAVLGVLVVALLVVAAWAGDPRTSATLADCARTAGQVWLAAHGTAIHLPDGRFDLLPLGARPAAAGPAGAGRAVRVGAAAGHVGPRAAARAAASVALPYAGLCAGRRGRLGDRRAAAVRGLRRRRRTADRDRRRRRRRAAPDRLWRAAWLRLGDRTRRTLPAAVAAVSTLLAGGALLAGGSLLGHFGRATDLGRGRRAEARSGGAGLLLLGLSYVPIRRRLRARAGSPDRASRWGSRDAVGPFSPTSSAPSRPVPLLDGAAGGRRPAWGRRARPRRAARRRCRRRRVLHRRLGRRRPGPRARSVRPHHRPAGRAALQRCWRASSAARWGGRGAPGRVGVPRPLRPRGRGRGRRRRARRGRAAAPPLGPGGAAADG
jgi:hypothetical protein